MMNKVNLDPFFSQEQVQLLPELLPLLRVKNGHVVRKSLSLLTKKTLNILKGEKETIWQQKNRAMHGKLARMR